LLGFAFFARTFARKPAALRARRPTSAVDSLLGPQPNVRRLCANVYLRGQPLATTCRVVPQSHIPRRSAAWEAYPNPAQSYRSECGF
jgi:hypothetical protein